MSELARSRPAFTIPSILAIVCAIAAFALDRSGLAVMAAIGAIAFGIIGMLAAIIPGKRGGIVSVISIVLGAIGLIVGVLRVVF